MFPLTSVCRSAPGKERLYARVRTVRQINANSKMEISFPLELHYFAMNRTFKVCNAMSYNTLSVLRGPICVLKQIRVHWEANDTLHYLNQMFKIPLAIGTSYTHCIFSHMSEHIPSELKQSVVNWMSLWKPATPLQPEVAISISEAFE